MPEILAGKWCGYCGTCFAQQVFIQHLTICEKWSSHKIQKDSKLKEPPNEGSDFSNVT